MTGSSTFDWDYWDSKLDRVYGLERAHPVRRLEVGDSAGEGASVEDVIGPDDGNHIILLRNNLPGQDSPYGLAIEGYSARFAVNGDTPRLSPRLFLKPSRAVKLVHRLITLYDMDVEIHQPIARSVMVTAREK